MIKRPMKGDQVEDLSIIRFPVWAFPKIDGFRCYYDDGIARTSRLTRFPNSSFHVETEDFLEEYPLDSEIVVGKKNHKDVIRRTSSGLTSRHGYPDWHMWVFDCPLLLDMPFEQRYNLAGEVVASLAHPRVHLLKGKLIKNLKQLERYIKKQLRKGYEGIITRDPNGKYKEGKSTLREQGMLKIKPFKDFEARITGWYEEMRNTNEAKRLVTGKINRSSSKEGKEAKGTLGGFEGIVLDEKGKETKVQIRVGGGFTKEQRERFWLIKDELVAAGAIMKCKKQSVGEKDRPRHPTFIALRPEWDIAE